MSFLKKLRYPEATSIALALALTVGGCSTTQEVDENGKTVETNAWVDDWNIFFDTLVKTINDSN